MSFRTPLGRVKGLGSSNSGSHEWLLQKVFSVILAVLFLWFAFSMAFLLKSDLLAITTWMNKPLNITLLLTFISVGIYHAALGLQVVIEDYVHKTTKRIFYSYFVKTVLAILWVMLVVAVLNMPVSVDTSAFELFNTFF